MIARFLKRKKYKRVKKRDKDLHFKCPGCGEFFRVDQIKINQKGYSHKGDCK